VGLYKHGRTFELEALLSTRSLPEIYRKMVYMRWIARADRKLVASLDSLKQQQTAQQARLVAARAELQRLQEEQGKQQTDLTLAKAAESSLLKKIRTERVASESLAEQLDSATRRLRALLVDLQRKRELKTPAGPSTFEKRKGRLPWPLRGTVIASFGSRTHPLYKTKTSNLGIDIKAKPGSQAQAVADGRVSYADQFMGYGNLVILDHSGGYYTLYSNLDEMLVSVGSAVAEGSTVGTAREYLHFEVRKDGRPVDPAAWLAP
jgi:septal ring factor EnvC (AmiA/AmiB activator)